MFVLVGSTAGVGVTVTVWVAVGFAVYVWAIASSMTAWDGPQADTASDTKIKDDTARNIFLFNFSSEKLSWSCAFYPQMSHLLTS